METSNQQAVERISQNAQKMTQLEQRMNEIEKRIESIKINDNKNKIDEKISRNEIEKLYQETLKLYSMYNTDVRTRVNSKFVECFDEVAQRVYDSNKNKAELLDKKYELSQVLKEFEWAAKQEEERDNKLIEDLDELKSEYDFLQKNYDDITNENILLNKEIMKKNNQIGQLEDKLLELKGVIGKLTEVRVILNKYFSSHFDNFTAGEKKIINEVQQYRLDEAQYKKAMNELLKSGNLGMSEFLSRDFKIESFNESINPNQNNNVQQPQAAPSNPPQQPPAQEANASEEKKTISVTQKESSKPVTPNSRKKGTSGNASPIDASSPKSPKSPDESKSQISKKSKVNSRATSKKTTKKK